MQHFSLKIHAKLVLLVVPQVHQALKLTERGRWVEFVPQVHQALKLTERGRWVE
jgi:hypothetical protein